MFEIKGKVNTAICYAKVFEQEAVEQIRRMCDYELTKIVTFVLCQMYMLVKGVQSEQR